MKLTQTVPTGRAGSAPPLKRSLLSGSIAFALGFGALPGWAQDDEDDEKESGIERMVVTAQKREVTIQDTPFSITAKSGEELVRMGAQTLEEVSRNIASFTVQNLGPGQSQVAMRGVSAGQIVRDQPGVKEQVGIYLDESVISLSLFTPDLELIDLNRVEALRGPQGTLFGSGSLSGTVRYITNQPVLDSYEVNYLAEGSLVDNDALGGRFNGVINIPIGHKAALRAVAYYTRFAGFINAVRPDFSTDEDVNDGDRYGGRFALRIEPTPNFVITPRVVYQEIETDGFARRDAFNILANPFTTTRPAIELGKQQQFTQFSETFEDDFLLADLNLEYTFANNMSLTSVSSFTDRDIEQVRDATALTGSITGGTIGLSEDIFTLDAPLIDKTDLQVFTQELRLASDPAARLRWVFGGFYSDIERDYGQDLIVTGFEEMSGIPTAGPLAPTDVLFFSRIPYDFEQLAFFGEATYAITDRFDLTAGVRYFDFEETRELNFDGIFADTTVAEPGKTTSDGFSPRVMASYELSQNVTLNAQASKGFRLGGINDPLNVPLCSPQDLETFGGRDSFEDEELWNYEGGFKSVFMGGRARFNVAAFWMEIDDLQATLTAGTCSSRVVFNVPNSRSRGFDFELDLQPIDNLSLGIAGTYADSELRSTVVSVDEQGNESVVEGIEKGNRLPTVPEFQFSANAEYSIPLANGMEGFLRGDFQHVGSRFTQIGDQADGFGMVPIRDGLANNIGGVMQEFFTFDPELSSYQLGNVRAGIRGEQFELSLFVHNLWDEQAKLSLDQERGRLARVGFLINQPRTFGVTFRRFFRR
ncbi:MAG: TonB-dependent receptor [Wenzhouxiangellaceae bacterium]|nr:TonB-dependent receptor [Wenzhouxiangellaceae bacterium]